MSFFVVSRLFRGVRLTGLFKLGLKPAQLKLDLISYRSAASTTYISLGK